MANKLGGADADRAGLTDYFVSSLDEISAVGVTDSLKVHGLEKHTFQVTATGISTNVVIRIEGSLDNTNFGNIAADGQDETIAADGTYLFNRSALPLEYVRLRFVSGTATVNTSYAGRL